MKRTVVVTRPGDDGLAWVRALEQQGFDALYLPTLQTAPLDDATELVAALSQWATYHAVMFVSGLAVKHFFSVPGGGVEGLRTRSGPQPRLWCPGDGTAKALLGLGFSRAQIDSPPAHSAHFDSESLWQVVAPQVTPGHRLLVVRAHSGREWLSQQCTRRGGEVVSCVAYRRQLPLWTPAQCAQAERASQGGIWLLTSSEGVRNLQSLCPKAAWAQATALVTHPKIGEAATALGFGRVLHSKPAYQSVLLSLESQTDHV